MPKVRHGSLFFNGKKVATLQNLTYKLKSNDGQEIADSGAYNTDGIATSEVSCDTIVPVAGVGVGVVKALVNHEDVALTLGIIDGTIHELTEARTQEAEFTSEVASGKQTGKFSWHAGAPNITG